MIGEGWLVDSVLMERRHDHEKGVNGHSEHGEVVKGSGSDGWWGR